MWRPLVLHQDLFKFLLKPHLNFLLLQTLEGLGAKVAIRMVCESLHKCFQSLTSGVDIAFVVNHCLIIWKYVGLQSGAKTNFRQV